MIITYLGGECVKVQFGDIVLAFNPPSRESKLKAARFGADVVLVSLAHPDFNGVGTVRHGERQPFEISGPGEYEIKGIAVRGMVSESMFGGEKPTRTETARSGGRINTVYTVTLEGMKLVFLGALSSAELPAALKEELVDIDVLFVPIGSDGVLSPSSAERLAVALEPHLIIPIHFEGVGDKNALKQFLKEAGEERAEAQEKLTLKKKELEGKEGEIIVLKPAQ